MIRSVMGLRIGHIFVYDGALYKVTGFTTRARVNGKIIYDTEGKLRTSEISLLMSQIHFDEMWNLILFHEKGMTG